MAQQQLSTNTFGCAKWIVSSDSTQGTHTTIAGALTSASSGDTIFIRPGTYTENLTGKAGVNVAAFDGDSTAPNVTIVGKFTFTAAGTVSISNIRLQTNSDFLLAVTGSAASVVILNNCNLNCSNNTGISFTSSSASSQVKLVNCSGDLGTTGIGIFSISGSGNLYMSYCGFTNSGASTTASTASSGVFNCYYCLFNSPFSTSSTGGFAFLWTDIVTSATNTTAFVANGTGNTLVRDCTLEAGTAAALTIGGGATVSMQGINSISSTNAAPISGAGTIQYSAMTLPDGSTNNITAAITSDVTRIGSLTLQNPLTVANGGTGLATLTPHSVQVGAATSSPTQISVGATGTVLIGTTGADPSFSATPTLTSVTFGSGTALSVYQEGTWTPTMVGGSVAGTTTYTVQQGYYTKVGNMVTIWGNVQGSAATGTGTATFGGLPFTVKNQTNYAAIGHVLANTAAGWTWPAGSTSLAFTGTVNATTGTIYVSGTAVAGGALQMANATFAFEFSLSYQV